MNRHLLVALGLLTIGGVTAGLAQTAPGGIDLDRIEAQRKAAEDSAEALVAGALARSAAERAAASEVATGADANLRQARLPQSTDPNGPIDFDAMLAGAQGNLVAPRSGPMLVGFASLSMPEASLKRMIGDVTRAGGVIVFRGFPAGNPMRFAGAMRRLVAPGEAANVLIDPRLFRAFAIDAAPTYVAVASDYVPCDSLTCTSAGPPFDRLSGNVTTRFALETIAAADGPGAPVARAALAHLEQEP
jgi:conjugal transfer pilus assembly protein TrbC